jgi:hypothetical protein
VNICPKISDRGTLLFLFHHLLLEATKIRDYAMLLALLAILGQRSAHSLATGPVMAEPFISPLLFTITPALS